LARAPPKQKAGTAPPSLARPLSLYTRALVFLCAASPVPTTCSAKCRSPRGGKSELARLLLSSLLRCRVLLSSGGVASGALCFALIGVLDDTRS
jgi:hypothetical protein